MAKTSMNELKLVIAEILAEAKKKQSKVEKIKEKGPSVEAYGLYDEAFDFSSPLGAYNLYRQQGAVNWGPYTSTSPQQPDSKFAHPNVMGATRMKENDERALRAVVREVIENGLVPTNSAWAPLREVARSPIDESPWDAAGPLFEAWYDKYKESKKSSEADKKSSKTSNEHTKYESVKKHGQEKKKGR